MPTAPAYLRIATALRGMISGGTLRPGDKLPTEAQLRQQFGVSTTVVKAALSILQGEGLIEGRRGSGNYVRQVRRLTRRAHGRDLRTATGPTSPFARDATAAGQRPDWEHSSEHTTATPAVAARLGIDPGDPVMRTRYRFRSDGHPIQLSESHEPLAITGGTPVEWPEEGAAVGVVARMDTIGVRIDAFEERVTTRPASPAEIEGLELTARGSHVLVIERTYYAGPLAVETADIVLGPYYEVVYRVPVD
ncbi:GntR family transcriptional regulator [Micromonospora sp. WMMC415]|uniref:GntR family transcriptional regulator n=1 Tax=Micromonospora sp. WMMC415 TaxID=2675222 RepID=UPI0012B49BA6|nr:GntR family transcriptional regulator [Micromonospora sp. WMMC415]QGN50012.1 GntR family transcriptional regulator [Micromonospora sp. WMMC415]